MQTTRYARVKDLVLAACLVPASERGGFLDQACAGDDPLRREVESLLAFYGDSPDTVEKPVRVRGRAPAKARYRRGRIVAGRYRIERMVGRGGMGEVYHAYDGLVRQPVALKILHVSDDLHRRRLVEEVRLARQVTHSGVCRVYDVGEHEGSPFLTMELIQGADLAARLARSGALPSDEVTEIAVRLCEALAAAHEAGVLHRDLKPSNILVDGQGGIYITDFGIATSRARTLDTQRPETGRFGTPTYMAPEETEPGGTVTERTDLYSLGLVLYELLTGAPPFDNADLSTLFELQRSAIPEPPSRHVDVDAVLEAIILQLLAKDPEARPGSARAVLNALSVDRRGPDLVAPRTRSPHGPAESPAPQRERRQVLTLLCELVAPPTLAADPEWQEQVRIFNARCIASCRLLGGRVVRQLDRGLLVRFGYPRAREEDAEAAVRAGVGIVADARERPLVPPERGRLAAAVVVEASSVVVQSGRVVETDELGEEGARLQSWIEPDAVVVSATVLALVRDGFASDILEHRNGGPVRYRITGPRQRLGLDASGARLTPFVGRELELAQLERWWRDADVGKGRVVLVTGEAGLGKSRLVRELWQRVRNGGLGLEARCSRFHQNTPLHPLVETIAQAFGLDHAVGEELLAKLRHGLVPLGPRAEELLPAFSTWLSPGHDSVAATAGVLPEADRRLIIGAIVEWILALAETRPIVLVCEDVHWSDPTTLEAIDRLGDQVRLARVLLVLTCRPDVSLTWRGTPVSHLDLQPLSDAEARALVSAAPESKADTASLIARADGNPLFLEEMIKAANEARHTGAAAGVPSTLRSLLTARLDRLGAAKRLAQAASVCGRTFRYPVLASLAASDLPHAIDLDAGLARLLDAEIFHQRGMSPRASFTFKHALLQEAAYQSLTARDRRRWHGLLARCIPELDPDLAATQPEVVAMHWAAAGRPEDAFEWWNRAGLRALERCAYAEAVHTLEQALRALPRTGSPAQRRGKEIELRLALTNAETGRTLASSAVQRHVRRLEVLCAGLDGGDPLISALLLSARSRIARGPIQTARPMVERLVGLVDRVDDWYLRAAVYNQASNVSTLSGRLAEADRFFDSCLESYARAEPRSLASLTLDPVANARFTKGYREWLRGRSGSARRSVDEAVEHADRLAHPISMAFTRIYGAAIALLDGDTERSANLLTDGARIARDIESTGLLAFVRVLEPAVEPAMTGGVATAPLERVERVSRVERVEAALHDYEQTGYGFLLTLCHAELARAQEDEGQREEASSTLAAAIAKAARSQNMPLLPEMRRRRGELLVRLGRIDEAEAALRRALQTAQRTEAIGLELRAALSLSKLLAAVGRGAAARRTLATLLARLPADVDAPQRAEAVALHDSLVEEV